MILQEYVVDNIFYGNVEIIIHMAINLPVYGVYHSSQK